MFWSVWRVIGRFFNYDFIPRLPHIYAVEFDPAELTDDERRALARLGARDPRGLRLAMKRYGVDNLPDLIAVLEHHQPKRRIWHRLAMGLGRLSGGVPYDPHGEEMKIALKRGKSSVIIGNRLKYVLGRIDDED
jgi:hypothetical protein